MRFSLLASCALLALSSSVAAQSSDRNVETVAFLGNCVSVGSEVCGYSIKVLDNNAGKHLWITAEKLSQIPGRDVPVATETDRAAYPELDDGMTPSVLCYVNGRRDDTVIALARFSDTHERDIGVARAWRLDTTTGQLVRLDPDTVNCDNEMP